MTLQIMWWGSLVQSVTAELYLSLRKSQSFHSSKFNKRLDIHESSTGDNSAFVDSWIRTGSDDYDALLNWSRKAGRDGTVLLDLWGDFVHGVDLSSRAEIFAEIAHNLGLLIVLLPRTCFGGWCDALSSYYPAGFSPERLKQFAARMHTAKSNFEFLLNSSLPMALIESSITRKDFEHALGLNFQQSRKFAGLVHLIPREIASAGSMGFSESGALSASIQRILEDRYLGSDSTRWRSFVHLDLAPGATDFVLCQNPKSASSNGTFGRSRRRLLSRRFDGVFALSASWPLFLRTTANEASALLKPTLVKDEGARQFLIFLANYEAQLIAESRVGTTSRGTSGANQRAYHSHAV